MSLIKFYLSSEEKKYPCVLSLRSFKRLGINSTNIISMIKNKILNENEIEYISNFKYEARIKSYILGRYCSKTALKILEPNIDLKEVRIDNSLLGKPIVKGNIKAGYGVNISHTNDYGAAVAYEEACPVAIDIEIIKEENLRLFERIFTDGEKQICYSVNDNELILLYTSIWTSKEALGKILGIGIHRNFKLFEIVEIKNDKNGFCILFKNFPQYKVLSTCVKNMIISLCMIKKCELSHII